VVSEVVFEVECAFDIDFDSEVEVDLRCSFMTSASRFGLHRSCATRLLTRARARWGMRGKVVSVEDRVRRRIIKCRFQSRQIVIAPTVVVVIRHDIS
jgi:hypothetical protein